MILKYLVNRPLRTVYLPRARDFTWLTCVQASYLRSDVTYDTWYLLKINSNSLLLGGGGGRQYVETKFGKCPHGKTER